jgi:hypothetical protein
MRNTLDFLAKGKHNVSNNFSRFTVGRTEELSSNKESPYFQWFPVAVHENTNTNYTTQLAASFVKWTWSSI